MSHYNYLELQDYQKRIEQARQSGEADEVIEELEKRVRYLQKLLGMDKAPKQFSRKAGKKQRPDDDGAGETHYDFSPEWSQLPPEED